MNKERSLFRDLFLSGNPLGAILFSAALLFMLIFLMPPLVMSKTILPGIEMYKKVLGGCLLFVFFACISFGKIIEAIISYSMNNEERRFFYLDFCPSNFAFILPLLLGLFGMFISSMYRSLCISKVHDVNASIREKTGYDCNPEAVLRVLKEGLSRDIEPQKTFLSSKNNGISPNLLLPRGELQKQYDEFCKENQQYVKSIPEFCSLTPQQISHDLDGIDSIYQVKLEYLSSFRSAARLLALEMVSKADDLSEIRRINQEMKTIRDFSSHGFGIISMLVSIAVDAIRFDALCKTLQYRDYSEEEWNALIGEAPDWLAMFRKALAMETGSFQDIVMKNIDNKMFFEEIIGPASYVSWEQKTISILLSRSPVRIFLYRDLLFGVETLEKSIDLTHSETTTSRDMENLFSPARKELYVLSAMLLPSMSRCYEKCIGSNDLYRIMPIAWKVMKYRKEHNGELPEELSDVCEVPVARYSQKPLRFYKGTITYTDYLNEENKEMDYNGFCIYSCQPDGTDKSTKSSIKVIVPLQ